MSDTITWTRGCTYLGTYHKYLVVDDPKATVDVPLLFESPALREIYIHRCGHIVWPGNLVKGLTVDRSEGAIRFVRAGL